MPDICSLVLADHAALREGFASLEAVDRSDVEALGACWAPLADLLEVHAAAEEATFYPLLVREAGEEGDDETTDAIKDHNEIRDAVSAASGATVGEPAWWEAVGEARKQNDEHLGEEEEGAIPDLRRSVDEARRSEAGERYTAFKAAHAGQSFPDKDPEGFVEEGAPGD